MIPKDLKPVVVYIPSEYDQIEEGKRALIWNGCVNHPNPKLNMGVSVSTSIVIKKWNNGFETMNTFYRRSAVQ